MLVQKSRLFPLVLLEKDSLDFSFSGLKTAVKREIDARSELRASDLENESNNLVLTEEDMGELSYEVEEIISEILSKKLIRAVEQTHARMMCLAG